MPFQIVSVRGIGGSPPTDIVVEGLSDGNCEEVFVSVEGTGGSTGGTANRRSGGAWDLTIPNSIGLTCGGSVVVKAVCSLDGRSTDLSQPNDRWTIQALPCDGPCPSISSLQVAVAQVCDPSGKKKITISGVIQLATGQPGALYDLYEITPAGAVAVKPIPAPPTYPSAFQVDVDLAANATYDFEIRPSPLLHPGCAPIPFSVTLKPCDPPCCPVVKLTASEPVGCAAELDPARGAAVSLTASVEQGSCATLPPVVAYVWRTTFPSKQGESAAPPTWVAKSSVSTITSSEPLWLPDGSSGSAAPVALVLNRSGRYSVSVEPEFLGENFNCAVPPGASGGFDVRNCCPTLDRIDATSLGECNWSFSAITDPANPVGASFVWDFGDGSAKGTGRQVQHTFAPASARRVSVAMTVLDCPNANKTFDVDAPCRTGAAGPKVSGCQITAGTNGAGVMKVRLDREITQASATDPANYQVAVAGARQRPSSVAYDPITREVTLSGLSIAAGESATVTMAGLVGVNGAPIVANGRDNQASCAAPSGPVVDDNPWGCWLLFILGVIFAVGAAVLFTIGLCAVVSAGPAGSVVGVILLVIAAILLVLSTIFFLLWFFICVQGTVCAPILWALDFLSVLMVITGILAGIATGIGVFQQIQAGRGSALACGFIALLAALITFGYWSTLMAILYNLARRIPCLRPTDGGGGGGDGGAGGDGTGQSSSQLLGGSDFTTALSAPPNASRRNAASIDLKNGARNAVDGSIAVIAKVHDHDRSRIGLGTVVAATASRLGVPQCGGCAARAAVLNEAFSLGR